MGLRVLPDRRGGSAQGDERHRRDRARLHLVEPPAGRDVGVSGFGKVGAWPPGKLFRLADAVDYWDGEV